MILGHIMGLPIEESFPQLAPLGAATMTAAAIAGRAALGHLKGWVRHRDEPDVEEV
jgi:hypothetical protein